MFNEGLGWVSSGLVSDLFDIGCREDSDFAVGLPEPPAVLLLVVDVDHLPVGDAQLVVPGDIGFHNKDREEELVIRHINGLDC